MPLLPERIDHLLEECDATSEEIAAAKKSPLRGVLGCILQRIDALEQREDLEIIERLES